MISRPRTVLPRFRRTLVRLKHIEDTELGSRGRFRRTLVRLKLTTVDRRSSANASFRRTLVRLKRWVCVSIHGLRIRFQTNSREVEAGPVYLAYSNYGFRRTLVRLKQDLVVGPRPVARFRRTLVRLKLPINTRSGGVDDVSDELS